MPSFRPRSRGWRSGCRCSVYPKTGDEAMERIKLLSQENAQLRAELGSLKDRLAVVERIVTDEGHRLSHEIEALRRPAN